MMDGSPWFWCSREEWAKNRRTSKTHAPIDDAAGGEELQWRRDVEAAEASLLQLRRRKAAAKVRA